MRSILIVDDDTDSRDVLARLLQRQGYRVRTAGSGTDALHALGDALPDLIVVDFMMPQMSGIEFLRVLRSYQRWSKIAVMLVTAAADGPHIEQAKQLGVVQCFVKGSMDLDDLLACVRALFAEPA